MKNNDAAVKVNGTLIIEWKKSLDGLNEFMQLMNRMRKIKEIHEFLNTHELYGEEITHNACYDLIIEEKAAYVYLKGNNVAAVAQKERKKL